MDVVGDDPQAVSQAKCAVRAQAIALCHVGKVWRVWARGVMMVSGYVASQSTSSIVFQKSISMSRVSRKFAREV